MRWLIGLALVCSAPTADIVAQEVRVAELDSSRLLSAAVPSSRPEPKPETIRDDAMQGTFEIGFDLASVRFVSSPFNSTTLGLNGSVDYYFRDHFAVEGSITSAWDVQSSSDSDAKYLFYGGGAKLSTGNRRIQPFVHALAGGVHMYPQMAFGNNGFAVQVGGGAEKRLRPRLWLRLEGDYVRSWLFKSGQNNFQGLVGIHYRF